MTLWKSNIKNCSFGCFFYAFMRENWMTEMPENWEVTDSSHIGSYKLTVYQMQLDLSIHLTN